MNHGGHGENPIVCVFEALHAAGEGDQAPKSLGFPVRPVVQKLFFK